MKLLFATTNRGKLEELEALVKGLRFEILSLRDVPPMEVEEDRETLAENAVKKATAWAARTGLASLADDTGLCVAALGGAPGVRSARWGGVGGEAALGDASARYRANNEKLLRELAGVPPEKRGAEFRCAMCLAVPGGEPVVVEGVCPGRIGEQARGGGGFGYDPLFELPELGKTFGELTADEKNRLSHRARAFRAIRPHLERLAASSH